MQETLAQVAEERRANILFNMQVVIVDLEKSAVRLKDGAVMEADLIIGADGKHLLRRSIKHNVSRLYVRNPGCCRWWNSNPNHQAL